MRVEAAEQTAQPFICDSTVYTKGIEFAAAKTTRLRIISYQRGRANKISRCRVSFDFSSALERAGTPVHLSTPLTSAIRPPRKHRLPGRGSLPIKLELSVRETP